MKYLNESFKNDIKKYPKYQEMIKQMQVEVDDFASSFHDDPNINSEWGHYYFCNNCLQTNRALTGKDDGQVCPVCGSKDVSYYKKL